MTGRLSVQIVDDLRELAAKLFRAADVQYLLLEAADRLEHFAWDGMPPRTPHLAADSSPVAGDVDAGASSTPTRRVDLPASRGLGGGEVRLATAAMPLAAAEFSDSDPCNPHGLMRPMPRLWVVRP